MTLRIDDRTAKAVRQLGLIACLLLFQFLLRVHDITLQGAFVDATAAKNSLKLAQENYKTFQDIVSINQA